jgi:hypothetical protein
VRPATAPEALLIGWLQRLVALLVGAGGAVARQFAATVVDRTAVLQLDDARLALSAARDPGGAIDVRIAPAEADADAHVRTRGDVLRDVIDGRALLDAAIADGRLDVRAALADLLAFHELVMLALALGPRSAALRALWAEFAADWPRGGAGCAFIDRQAALHGTLRAVVPDAVRHARSPLAEGGSRGP